MRPWQRLRRNDSRNPYYRISNGVEGFERCYGCQRNLRHKMELEFGIAGCIQYVYFKIIFVQTISKFVNQKSTETINIVPL